MLRNASRTWSGAALDWARRVFASFSVRAAPAKRRTYTLGLDVQPATGYADSGNLDRDLSEMFHEVAVLAGAHGVGLLLAIDELQEVERPTLAALNATTQPRPGPGPAAVPDGGSRAALTAGDPGRGHVLRGAALRVLARRPSERPGH